MQIRTAEEMVKFVTFERRLAFAVGMLNGSAVVLCIMGQTLPSLICFFAVGIIALMRVQFLK